MSARTSGGDAPAFSTHRRVASLPGIALARVSAEPRKLRSGLSAAARRSGRRPRSDGETTRARAAEACCDSAGLTVALEDRAGRLQPCGRPAGLDQASGVEKIERGRLRPLAERSGDARPREHGPRRGIADVGQGEEGRLANPLVPAVREGQDLLHRLAAAGPAERLDEREARAPGRLVQGLHHRPARPRGPPMVRSAAVAGPASASSTRYFSRGRTDSCFPTSLDLGEEERGDRLVLRPGEGVEQGLGRRGPLGLGPGPRDVDGEPVHGEAGAGIVPLPRRQDAGADVRDRPGPQAQDLGAQAVLLRGRLRREAREDRRDAPLQVRRGRVGGGEARRTTARGREPRRRWPSSVLSRDAPGGPHGLVHEAVGLVVADEPLRLRVEAERPAELDGDLPQVDERAGAVAVASR